MAKPKPPEAPTPKLQPVEAYLHLKERRKVMTVKFPETLRWEMDVAVSKLHTAERPINLNSFCESALRWYLDALKDGGVL